jgi:D-arabinose 1-dehydrogenase-like Zn-dependent alcohol dehydrogenase
VKAIRLTKPNQPLQECEVEIPALGGHDVLVRVRAAGICHSDAHYRDEFLSAGDLPVTIGHEVAGIVEEVGAEVRRFEKGDRVCLHYLVTCGHCAYCRAGTEQFCLTNQMIGRHRDGGYAEFVIVPERCVFSLPDEIPFEQGAILMCSSATSLHALNKTRLRPGETVALFGIGGLGISAIQLAKALGASEIFAVDINPRKLEVAETFGAVAINAKISNPVDQIRERTGKRGVDVALELIGLPATMRQAVQVLAIFGRAGLVGLTKKSFEIEPYDQVLNKEAEIIGVSDHLATEIPQLLECARTGRLNLSHGIIRTIPLDPDAVNATLDNLQAFGNELRVVITP